jgi:hypothetical protein
VSVDLGAAGNYAMLAETLISDVPTSAVTGDVASSGTGAAIGIPCPEVTGTIYEVDGTGPGCFVQDTAGINTAVLNKGTAFTTANGLAACVTNLGAGTLIAGVTMDRGTYLWTTDLDITGNIHLDALGDSTARWVFQVNGGNLILESGVQIIMDNGALPENVLWTTTGYTWLHASSHFEGTVIAASYIALDDSASVNGKLLTHTAITLIHNVINYR